MTNEDDPLGTLLTNVMKVICTANSKMILQIRNEHLEVFKQRDIPDHVIEMFIKDFSLACANATISVAVNLFVGAGVDREVVQTFSQKMLDSFDRLSSLPDLENYKEVEGLMVIRHD